MILAAACAVVSLAGVGQSLAAARLTARFAAAHASPAETGAPPPITVLKPLHGGEPMLTEALETLCTQTYAAPFQIVFGVGDAHDRAVPVVEALRRRHPGLDIDLVIDPTRHGANPKIGNLINMFPAAKHDVIVIADSDVHARPDYLTRLAAALAKPGVGLVTTLYTGLPAFDGLSGRLGAAQITWGFLPGALLARALGRRDCLGATMALRRDTLTAIGGLEALKDHLADDNVLGRLVRAHGREVALAGTVVATTVPETTLAALWRHELRWARTILTLEPAGFAASIVQYSLLWAFLGVVFAPASLWTWFWALGVWALRAHVATAIDRSLRPMLGGLAFDGPLWLLPVRDLLSAAEWLVSPAGRRVDWRGHAIQADTPPRFTDTRPSKGSHAR
jgi:ceramide glucosyltransferase